VNFVGFSSTGVLGAPFCAADFDACTLGDGLDEALRVARRLNCWGDNLVIQRELRCGSRKRGIEADIFGAIRCHKMKFDVTSSNF
jgi:hypothetical protein